MTVSPSDSNRSRALGQGCGDLQRALGKLMKTVGQTLLFVAILLALVPVLIAGRGSHPSTQVYQDAKGSWMPSAYAYSNPRPFFVAASIVGVAGVGLIAGFLMTRRHPRQQTRK